jgi:hypothetical protein
MSEQGTRVVGEELQFDRVVQESSPETPPAPAEFACSACRGAITTAYYSVNGQSICRSCRATLHAAAETPRGIGPLFVAGLFGLGAGIAGAVIYYAVIAITNFEIGFVAILIGYMVGYSVRKGASGRGGRRFQVLAALLTYASVAFAYSPIAVRQLMKADRAAEQQAVAPAGSTPATSEPETTSAAITPALTPRSAAEPIMPGRFLFALTMVSALVLALPVLVVVGSLPSGLISAFIIFIGMRQAWRMTGSLALEILGPYRVGLASVIPGTPGPSGTP